MYIYIYTYIHKYMHICVYMHTSVRTSPENTKEVFVIDIHVAHANKSRTT